VCGTKNFPQFPEKTGGVAFFFFVIQKLLFSVLAILEKCAPVFLRQHLERQNKK
jgi:hypothetical protein